MSRGPGTWQRGILAAVEHYGMVYLRDLVPDDARKSDRNAIERAAWRLVAAHRIELVAYRSGRPRLLAVRPGLIVHGRPSRAAHRPLSVGVIPPTNVAHTYSEFAQAVDARIGGQWPAYLHTRHSAEKAGRKETSQKWDISQAGT